MIDIEAQLLGQDTGWREVLEAYRPVETEDQEEVSTDSLGDESFEELAAPETGEDEVRLADLSGDDSDDGNWLPRVTSLEGIEDERTYERRPHNAGYGPLPTPICSLASSTAA